MKFYLEYFLLFWKTVSNSTFIAFKLDCSLSPLRDYEKKNLFLIWFIHHKQPIERGSLNSTLQENVVKSSNNLVVSHDERRSSSDSFII